MANLVDVKWDDFSALPLESKRPYLERPGGRGEPYHTLFAQQFDRALLQRLADLASRIRFISKEKRGAMFLKSLLPHKRAMLYFTQPSSRTFLSHLSACQILGLSTGSVRDPSISSELKGETKEDTIRTFSSYFDLIIMRCPEKGLAEKMAWELSNSERPVPILNAGSGKDQHPTQALLDIYTLLRSFENSGGIENKTVAFCGDLLRGRTVRSLSYLLTNYPGVKQIFVAPEQLQVPGDVIESLKQKNVEFEISYSLQDAVPRCDAVYMTRIQDEWDASKGESAKIDTSEFKFGARELALLPKKSIIMHPLPRRDEIAVCCDHDPRAMYWRQMRNGMWIRAALIALTFGFEDEILSFK